MSNTTPSDDCIPPEPPNRRKLGRIAASGVTESAQRFLNKPLAKKEATPMQELSPTQVGELARIIMYAVRRYPEPVEKVDDKGKPLDGPMEWELCVERLLRLNEAGMPSYLEIKEHHSSILDFLIEYYGTQENTDA